MPDAALRMAADTARLAQAAGWASMPGTTSARRTSAEFLARVPGVQEVSIGHALISEALYAGLDATVRAYRHIVDAAVAGRVNA
jgi:pyridoxine 5-phosphate synthase